MTQRGWVVVLLFEGLFWGKDSEKKGGGVSISRVLVKGDSGLLISVVSRGDA